MSNAAVARLRRTTPSASTIDTSVQILLADAMQDSVGRVVEASFRRSYDPRGHPP